MPIDFDALVLAPNQATFARAVIIEPLVSQPGEAAYTARGIWTVVPVDPLLLEGQLGSSTIMIDLRLSEFVVMPRQGDRLTVGGVVYLIDDLDDDGQGAASVTLKIIER